MGRGIIGNYLVERELGRGGMGVVYAATHRVLGRPAAIKLLLVESGDRVERFFNEARAAMAIDHPGVVKVYDVGIADDGRPYLAMELLTGSSLDARLAHGPLPLRTAIDHARQIAGALAAAHAVGVVHRDLKPENIFVLAQDGRLKLVDFGIAKLADPVNVRTATGALIGTPAYMSPEQCEGLRELDARSDLYSLGCVLFAMLTGGPPFEGGGTGGLIASHLYAPPPSLRARCPTASAALEAVVMRLLAKSPDARYRDARAVLDALADPEVERLAGSSGAAMTAEAPPGHAPTDPRAPALTPHDAPSPRSSPRSPAVGAPPHDASALRSPGAGSPQDHGAAQPQAYPRSIVAPQHGSTTQATVASPVARAHPEPMVGARGPASAREAPRRRMLVLAILGCAASAAIAIVATRSCTSHPGTTVVVREDAGRADAPADAVVVAVAPSDSALDGVELRALLKDAGPNPERARSPRAKLPDAGAIARETPRPQPPPEPTPDPTPQPAREPVREPERPVPPLAPANLHIRVPFAPESTEPDGEVAELAQVAQVLTDHPKLRLQITGHAESGEGGRSPATLAENRGQAIKSRLVARGIATNRIVVMTWLGPADGTHRVAIISLVAGSPRALER